MTFNINIAACPADMRVGLTEIMTDFPERFSEEEEATPLRLVFSFEPGLRISRSGKGIEIAYGKRIEAFRALGCLMGAVTEINSLAERNRFEMLGVMVDVSRNGVLTVPVAKNLLRRCALMGINTLMLYSEDTYEVPGEPFFGYLRGRYSYEEMQELDDYADALGIEMMPCIQTLGHLEQILQWPAYAEYRDTWGILLADEQKTYNLLEKMITAASAPFRSQRIHIGMDEAHGLGTGRYKDLHGANNPFELLNKHLAGVRDICQRLGLRPMIWSDMYFSLASPRGNYYDPEFNIPREVIENIPGNVDLVYWDYYHTNASDYALKIDQHRAMKCEPIVAGGGWTWGRLWAALPYSFTATNACMTACKEKGVRQFFLTLWGDDGMECDIFSALPAMQLMAEHAYAGSIDEGHLRANFLGSCGASMDDWFTASQIDYLAFLHDGSQKPDAVSKWLLWHDTLLGLYDPYLEGVDLKSYYTQLAERLEQASRQPGLSARLRFPAAIARAVSLKAHLRRQLAEAYHAKDMDRLLELRDDDLGDLRQAVDKLWRTHRDMWLETYKPFGLEIIEQRYGGIRTRLESLSERLIMYIDGTITEIPELETVLLRFDDTPLQDLSPDRRRVQTPSCIKP